MCSRSSCGKPATCVPAIEFRAPAIYQDAPCIPMIANLPICDECLALIGTYDIVSRHDQEKFADVIERSGKVRPDLDRTTMGRRPLDDPDYLKMLAMRAEQS